MTDLTQEDIEAAEKSESALLDQHLQTYLNRRLVLVSAELTKTKERLAEVEGEFFSYKQQVVTEAEAAAVIARNPDVGTSDDYARD